MKLSNKDKVNPNKVFGKGPFGELTKQEKTSLLTPMKPLNFKYANRPHAICYMNLLEAKINAIREVTRLGKDFGDNQFKFTTEFVYHALVDMWQVMDAYLTIKDELLYAKYAEGEENKYFCEDCNVLTKFSADQKCLC